MTKLGQRTGTFNVVKEKDNKQTNHLTSGPGPSLSISFSKDVIAEVILLGPSGKEKSVEPNLLIDSHAQNEYVSRSHFQLITDPHSHRLPAQIFCSAGHTSYLHYLIFFSPTYPPASQS